MLEILLEHSILGSATLLVPSLVDFADHNISTLLEQLVRELECRMACPKIFNRLPSCVRGWPTGRGHATRHGADLNATRVLDEEETGHDEKEVVLEQMSVKALGKASTPRHTS